MGFPFELLQIDLRAIQNGAPVTHCRSHRERLADVLFRGWVSFSCGGVKICDGEINYKCNINSSLEELSEWR